MANDVVPPKPPNSELLSKFLENQTKEIEQRANELELERQKDANALEYGKCALEAQERDRRHERDSKRGEQRDRHILVGGLVLLLAVVIITSMALGFKDVAIEIGKAVALLSAGAVGGYGYAKSKKDEDS